MQKNYRIGNDDFPAVVAVNPDGTPIGSGSSGGGGAVTVADGADATQGAKADTAATNTTSSWSVVALLKGLLAAGLAPTPAGTNSIGTVGLNTGSNVIGGVTEADGANSTLGAKADAAWASGSGSVVAVLKGIFGLLAGLLKVQSVIWYLEAGNVSVGAGASLVGSTRSSGSSSGTAGPFSYVTAMVYTNQSGTLVINTGYGIFTTAVSSGSSYLKAPMAGPSAVVTLINGSTAASGVNLVTMFSNA